MSKYNIDIEQRAQRGAELFEKGYNCSQSVVAAFADIYGLNEEIALRMSASFGGGMGRMRLTCGTVTGMFMLAGLENGSTQTDNMEAKTKNYATVQNLAKEFEKENGSITCATLLGLRAGTIQPPQPSKRNAEYYRSRPCLTMVQSACRIYARFLNSLD